MTINKQRGEASILFLSILVVITIIFLIWFYFFASCGFMSWIPTSDIPGRCNITIKG